MILLAYSSQYHSYGARGLLSSNSVLLIAALAILVLGLIAQARVRSVFRQYFSLRASCGLTASQVAGELLRNNGSSVSVRRIQGSLTDNYDPRTGCVSLSSDVFDSSSVAAIAVAAHECGHVMQYEHGYNAIKLRNTILPAAKIGSHLSYLLVIAGLFLPVFGHTVSMIGVVLFGFVLAFQLLTLPIELNASQRALDMLNAGGYITIGEEESAARKVLRAAAFTYVVAVLSAAVTFLRLLAYANSGRRN